jgi:two-component system cell cycle response regulator DivK
MQTRTPHVSSLAPLVLLVDDDEASRGLYAEYLTSVSGYRVAEAADGKQGVELATEIEPEVIVMDMTLPVLDGRGAMLALRGDPRTHAIPIVALTGRVELKSSNEPATEFQVVLVKPCLPDALANAIESLLKR